MSDFNLLYRKYAPDVYRFALNLTGERAEAQDITSETFVRAWTSPEPIEMTTVKGDLFTIQRNLFLQGLRKKSRQAAIDDALCDPQAGPYKQAEEKEKLDRCWRNYRSCRKQAGPRYSCARWMGWHMKRSRKPWEFRSRR